MVEKKYFEVALDFKGKPFLFDKSSLTALKESYLGLGRGTIGLYFGEDSTLSDTRTGSEVNCSARELWDLLMKAEFKLKELRQEFHKEQLRELREQRAEAERIKRKQKLVGEKRHWFSKRSYVKTFEIVTKKTTDNFGYAGDWFLMPVSKGML